MMTLQSMESEAFVCAAARLRTTSEHTLQERMRLVEIVRPKSLKVICFSSHLPASLCRLHLTLFLEKCRCTSFANTWHKVSIGRCLLRED